MLVTQNNIFHFFHFGHFRHFGPKLAQNLNLALSLANLVMACVMHRKGQCQLLTSGLSCIPDHNGVDQTFYRSHSIILMQRLAAQPIDNLQFSLHAVKFMISTQLSSL